MSVEYKGKKYASIREFAIKNNLNINTVYARFRKGMTLEEVLNYKRKSTFSKPVEYNGITYDSRLEFANKFEIPYYMVSACLNAGYTPKQIIELSKLQTVDRRQKPKQPITFNGRTYATQKEIAEEYGVDFESFRHKVYCGLSIEDALGLCDFETQNKKEIWMEFMVEDEPVDAEKGYEILRDLGLDKNTNSAEFDDIEDSKRQKWMYIK